MAVDNYTNFITPFFEYFLGLRYYVFSGGRGDEVVQSARLQNLSDSDDVMSLIVLTTNG